MAGPCNVGIFLVSAFILCVSADAHWHRGVAGFVTAAGPGLSLRSNERSAVCTSGRRPRTAERIGGCLVGLRAAVDQATVDKLVKKVQDSSGGAAAKGGKSKLAKALKKPTGAPTVCVEFGREDGVEPHKIDDASLAIRRAKVPMIVVDTALPSDGNGAEDLEKFVKEQATAKGNFPGPAAVVWRGNIKTVEDVARAAAAGCDGVSINMGIAGEAAEELISAALTLGIDPIAEVEDKDQINRAVEAGVTVIQVRFDSTAVESFKAFAAVSLRKEIPDNCIAVATVAGRQGGPEVQMANQMLGAKYHSVLFSGMISDCTKPANEKYVCYVVSLILSKKSSKLKINEAKGGREVMQAPQGWGDSSTHV